MEHHHIPAILESIEAHSDSSSMTLGLYVAIRTLTIGQGANLVFGHFPQLFKDPSGVPQQRWIEEVPNEGLLRYFFAFNVERVFPTTPKALAEVLVTKNYDFIKPPQMKQGIGQLLGIGILLAEGDEHRVSPTGLTFPFHFNNVLETTQAYDARIRIPTCERSLSCFLGEG